jgi:FMN phosphatase YigB (HAD superfamily)
MKKIFIIDLHNTIIDELAEYGPAIKSGFKVFFDELKKTKKLDSTFTEEKFLKEKIYPNLKKVHAKYEDDWNPRIYNKENISEIFNLFNDPESFESARKSAVAARNNFSKEYMSKHSYDRAVETLIKLTNQGHKVFIVTDGTEHIAHPTLKWLGLDGKISGAYCCKSPDLLLPNDMRLEKTKVTPFENGAVKPNAKIVAQVVLDVAKSEDLIPKSVSLSKVFKFEKNHNSGLFDSKKEYIYAKLKLRNTRYSDVLKELLNNTIGVGDDYRDFVLHRNSGIISLAVDYYNKIPGFSKQEYDTAQSEGKEILKQVTGWNPERMNLFTAIKSSTNKKSYLDSALSISARLQNGFYEIESFLNATKQSQQR